MKIIVLIIIVLIVLILWYLRRPIFGKAPQGERLKRIQQSPNYKNGKFQNRTLTPTLAENTNMLAEVYKTFLKRIPNKSPLHALPTTKTDLHQLPTEGDFLVWFGHSSYFLQVAGQRFLVDPVMSGAASPMPWSVRAFSGTDVYTPADIPEIDVLLLSHDHYDHLDYRTVKALKNKVKQVICGLGVGAHLEAWGFEPWQIIEMDWDEQYVVNEKIRLHTTTARHGSGRGFRSNNTLWLSYVLETPHLRIFIGGDSGYDRHFAEIGEKFQGFDVAILENGQYSESWPYIHMLPSQTFQAAKDLKTKRLFPVHSSKFVLARHAWNEPLEALSTLATSAEIPLITPMIGRLVPLNDEPQTFNPWWKEA